MTTTVGHSFYIGPIGSFYNQVNDTGSWEPLVTFDDLACPAFKMAKSTLKVDLYWM
jgi:hypothetical protein